jgi:superfamily I DNA/RNA helicase
LLQRLYDIITANKDAIKISTIHKAKGLENERVFILEYDKLPWKRFDMQPWEITQELNLKYVAITRAKQELYLVKSDNVDNAKIKATLFDTLPRL